MEGKPPEKKEKGLIGKLKDAAEDKEHQLEVLVPTTIAAVTAVAATTVTQPIIQNLKEKIQKFLNNKIKKWKENRKKKKDSSQSSKKI